MNDQEKTQEQLINELTEMRQRIAELETAETERGRAEEALRGNKGLYSNIIESMSDGIMALDSDFHYTHWNHAMERISKVPREELVGTAKRPWDVFPHLVEQGVDEMMRRAMHGEMVEREAIPYRLPNGTSGFTSEIFLPLRTATGEVCGIVGVIRDITERKQAEEVLRESEQRLALAVDGSNGGQWHYEVNPNDPSHAISDDAYFSPRLKSFIGYGDDEFPNSLAAWESRIVPEDLEMLRESSRAHRAGQTDSYEIEYRICHRDGSIRWIHSRGRVQQDERGRPIRFAGIDWDITERKRAEEELLRLYEQAKRDAETRATLLREVNHRVKNNLTAIIGLLHIEQSYAQMSEQAAYQAITQSLTSRISGLATVHSLLTASEWAPLPLSDLAGQVIKSAMQIRPRDKQVFIDVHPSPLRVTPDQAHNLSLIINELATNTIEHALPGRNEAHIGVHIALEGDAVSLEYRDDGPGYPEDVLQMEHHAVGFDLIQNLTRRSLRGELSLHNDEGAVAVIRFPAQALGGTANEQSTGNPHTDR
jgi:PAS domain S-box-containing protein